MIRSRLALAAGATLAALALGEIALRLFFPPRPMVVWRQFAGIAERVNAVPAEELFANDPELFWRFRPGLERTDASGPLFGILSNSQGLREDHEIPSPKGEGEVRVLFLGDSCTFGEYLSHAESFVQGVEDSLRSLFPGAAVECINAGVPGYTLFQGWRFLETEGYGYEPDVVVVYFGWNEGASWGGMSDPQHYEALRAQLPVRPLRWSRIGRMLWQAAASQAPPEGNGPASRVRRPRLRPDEFRGLLARVRESTRRRGVELLVLVGPHRNNIAGHPRQALVLPGRGGGLLQGGPVRPGRRRRLHRHRAGDPGNGGGPSRFRAFPRPGSSHRARQPAHFGTRCGQARGPGCAPGSRGTDGPHGGVGRGRRVRSPGAAGPGPERELGDRHRERMVPVRSG